MKALLIDVDSRDDMHNNAIAKLLTYYNKLGWDVQIMKLKLPGYPHKRKPVTIDASGYDIVRASIIFTINRDMIQIINCDDILIGGTGYNIGLKLPDEVDNLLATPYGNSTERIEFITRGCIRDCYFCVVREKEGYLYEYRSIERILDTYKAGEKLRFFDNNFLAWDKANEVLKILIHKKIPVSFNEGLDIRLINDENAKLLSKLNNYRPDFTFAFDDWKLLPIIEEKTAILQKYFGKWRLKYYVFTDASKPIFELIARVLWCKKNCVVPYVMRYHNCYDEDNNKDFYTDMAAWTNQVAHFKKTTFDQFLMVRHRRKNGIINIKRVESSSSVFRKNNTIEIGGKEDAVNIPGLPGQNSGQTKVYDYKDRDAGQIKVLGAPFLKGKSQGTREDWGTTNSLQHLGRGL